MAPRAVRDGVMMSTVSSPARVPATSRQCSESTAAARGWAPPGGVFCTSIFCAGRISSKNSFRARATAKADDAPPVPALARALKEFLLDIRPAQNMLVLKTPPGGAQPLAAAVDSER